MTTGAEIQIEDGGFTRVHNAILETLTKAHLSPLEFRIVLLILRKTYGYQKKTDVISLTQFEECGASRVATIDALQNLARLNVITRTKHGQSYEYGLNKYIETWLPEVFETRRPHQANNFGGKTSKADGTSKPDDTSKADGTSTSKPDDTKTSKADGTHKRKKERIKEINTPREIPEHQRMFGALATACQLDQKLKAGQIAKTAKTLLSAGYTVEDVERFLPWWNEFDFRGQKHQPPSLAQLVENIFRAKQYHAGKQQQPYSGAVILPDYLEIR